jgi:ADP-heptose:LPS heptosyltransferase/predicted SAM-dependent methyltransferase
MEKAYPHFIGIDNGHHFGKGAADIAAQADDLSMFADESMDFVFSSHVLEHMEDPAKTLSEWWRVIRPGGYLALYLPHRDFYPNISQPGANPDHKHDFVPTDISAIMSRLRDLGRWEILENEERNEVNEYSFFQVYRKSKERGSAGVCGDISGKRKGKTACVVRYGGFGDMLQTAVVLPQLKAQGFHVTVMTTPKGADILKHDPNVDDFYLQDTDQVPNEELPLFWAEQAKRFDRFVNLSESIEGTLLAMAGRSNHAWPPGVRRKRLNLNYHEWTAELAGVPFKPCQLFYPSQDERIAAVRMAHNAHCGGISGTDILNPFNILWALSGSSLHKFYPHQDAVIARILVEIPEARIFLVGDETCRLLEQGWEDEPRVWCMSGKLSIRDTLALAGAVDLVVGPETGVLNAVGMDKTPHKVLFLSHSSANNLSKHWVNVQALRPVDCPCHPCHQLHYTREFCVTNEETGAALCAYNIPPFDVFEAVMKVYRNWRKK